MNKTISWRKLPPLDLSTCSGFIIWIYSQSQTRLQNIWCRQEPMQHQYPNKAPVLSSKASV